MSTGGNRPLRLMGTCACRTSGIRFSYIHVVHNGDEVLIAALREAWPHGFILNRAGAELQARLDDVQTGLADLASFGRMALANPDLVERIRREAPLNDADPATFYGGDEDGYTDYPRLAAVEVA